jgi:hypothetical protein
MGRRWVCSWSFCHRSRSPSPRQLANSGVDAGAGLSDPRGQCGQSCVRLRLSAHRGPSDEGPDIGVEGPTYTGMSLCSRSKALQSPGQLPSYLGRRSAGGAGQLARKCTGSTERPSREIIPTPDRHGRATPPFLEVPRAEGRDAWRADASPRARHRCRIPGSRPAGHGRQW